MDLKSKYIILLVMKTLKRSRENSESTVILFAWSMQVLMKHKTTTATSKFKTNTDRKQNITTKCVTYIL